MTSRYELALLVLVPLALTAQEPHHHSLGTVNFPVSCSPAAQKTFNTGVALLHSFWYSEAEKTFAQIVRADPTCAMAYWGIAMSVYHPLWAPPNPADLQKGAAAVVKAKSAAAKTQRERDYIAAIEIFYRDAGKVNHHDRALAWRDAMQQLSAKYPDDPEAAVMNTFGRNTQQRWPATTRASFGNSSLHATALLRSPVRPGWKSRTRRPFSRSADGF